MAWTTEGLESSLELIWLGLEKAWTRESSLELTRHRLHQRREVTVKLELKLQESGTDQTSVLLL